MTSFFYTELTRIAVELRSIQHQSRASSPGIKLLSASNTGKNLNPTFDVPNANPKPLFNSKGPAIGGKPMANFPYQKPAMKGGLRDATIAKPSATPNMQV